jgi:hypothetical protein
LWCPTSPLATQYINENPVKAVVVEIAVVAVGVTAGTTIVDKGMPINATPR